jgi:hypothetical protein
MADETGTAVVKKLALLLPHLIQHNDEHAEDLEKWIATADEGGCKAAAREMRKAKALMKKIGDHLKSAEGSVGISETHPHDHAHGHAHPHTHPHAHLH